MPVESRNSSANSGHSPAERAASAPSSSSGASTPAAACVAPPPGSPRSITHTRSPRCWARQAVARPMIPPPTIAASYRSIRRTIGCAAVNGTQRRARLARSRLYLVLEARPHGNDPSALLDAALRGGVDVVQLRDKELADQELVRAAEPFRRACDAHGALFVLNDRPDLAERTHADGVHVGYEDASLADARHVVGPDRLVGLSARTVDELQGDADYFGVGAIYSTPTKAEADAGGLALVRAARDTLRVPWFVIGGIDADTIQDVVASGAAGVAVVRAIRDAADPEAAAHALRALLPPTEAVVAEGDKDIRLPQIDWLEWSLAPGELGARPHAHAAHTHVFFVLAGAIEMRLGSGTGRLPAGTCGAAPPLLRPRVRQPGGPEARLPHLLPPGGGGGRRPQPPPG